MTIRVGYNQQVQPPAPFVHVTVGDPLGGAAAADIPAQIDSAADRTVVPLRVLEGLGLEPIDEISVGGLGGSTFKLQVYVVSLAVRTRPGRLLRVLAHPDEPWVLLGLDVLNGHRLVLDGPNLVLELT